ncbi:hypothetical protein PVK06_039941 [Gossypium arboreum]|uniref:Uncharacterized protein n=1 Tax=Gossypium arboreum TaxID=29729 RepID=A0ABR0N462_GOSAR|nr:hypothetical protein PVK06_039941 [Gossypium arboreum]
MERMLLSYAIITERSINVGKIILKKIYDFARKKARSAYFSSLITSLCLRAQVKSKANLKGEYVQGCITRHDLERLVENIYKLNPPIEPKTNELSNKSKPKVDSVNKIEEPGSEKEPNNPKPIKEPKTLNQIVPLSHGRKRTIMQERMRMQRKKTKGIN